VTGLSAERRAELGRAIIQERQDRNSLALLRDLPDDAPVRIPAGFEEEIPYGTYASTLEELRRVIGECNRNARTAGRPGRWPGR
jgi:hypothetical protein